ncbi:hypothetical protein LSTR_LSTR007372 [Laodelphax striatellus]|uniref:Cytochrome c oxidase assembly protein COX15 n=1 Tax=Laodelphax striatellus TaxID=195883 RepID=A0A482XMT2_LAOST|nr:hypothetical protein LSTR_LSTR007372 [Laodelphax striatellus]
MLSVRIHSFACRKFLQLSGYQGIGTTPLKSVIQQKFHLFRPRCQLSKSETQLHSSGKLSLGKRLQTTAAIGIEQAVAKPTNNKAVGYWLLGCSGMVFGAVILGGVTRLTESGLSMVTWRLLGEKLPITEAEWKAEFSKYQEYPEYKMKNQNITLEEFKWIWWMEYGHRMWGRLIGACFYLPATLFWAKGWLTPVMKKRVVVFGALIAAQFKWIWWMEYGHRMWGRLIGACFYLPATLFWAKGWLTPVMKKRVVVFGALIAAQINYAISMFLISGAFVAGLDAGLVYNSFPYMGNGLIPSDILSMKPAITNFTENPTTVQFDHRILGTTTLCLISAMWLLSRKRTLPPRAYKAATAMATMAWMQVALGISTLLMYVPVPLAAAHQSGSLVLLSLAVWLSHELKHVKRIVK